MNEPQKSSLLEETVVIVGVGLIGGSLAAALRQRGVARTVIGVGRDVSRLQAAKRAGLIDDATTDLATAVARADVIVFCTPVDRVVEGVRLASQHVRPGALITDAGSVKQPICDALADLAQFVGSHPIAGSHRQGFEAADANLFDGRMCVLTPLSSATESRVERLDQFWRAVGMRTKSMSPTAHDRALAMTSHLPHVVASALAATLADDNRPLTGTGFRDTTRVAEGDSELWTGILLQNAENVLVGIDEVQHQLTAFREALVAGDVPRVRQLLTDGKHRREQLNDSQPTSHASVPWQQTDD
jgi:cyclohexadieny/prephenate dehydrogenase